MPASVLMIIGKITRLITTAIFDQIPTPNHKIKSGATAMIGVAERPETQGLRTSETRSNVAVNKPMMIPATDAIKKPTMNSSPLTTIAFCSVPVLHSFAMLTNDCLGDDRAPRVGRTRESARPSHFLLTGRCLRRYASGDGHYLRLAASSALAWSM